jgi:Protein of unknown function (DUF2628)
MHAMDAVPPATGPINPYAAPQTPADMTNAAIAPAHDLTREEVEAFVGDRHSYYWRAWKHAVGGSLRAGFNWPAFLFSFFWLLYRKMYRVFLIAMAAIIGLGVLQAVAGAITGADLAAVDRLTNFALAMTVGLLANGLYLRRARQVIGSARAQEPDAQRRVELLRARGGTSWIALLLGIAVAIALGALGTLAG